LIVLDFVVVCANNWGAVSFDEAFGLIIGNFTNVFGLVGFVLEASLFKNGKGLTSLIFVEVDVVVVLDGLWRQYFLLPGLPLEPFKRFKQDAATSDFKILVTSIGFFSALLLLLWLNFLVNSKVSFTLDLIELKSNVADNGGFVVAIDGTVEVVEIEDVVVAEVSVLFVVDAVVAAGVAAVLITVDGFKEPTVLIFVRANGPFNANGDNDWRALRSKPAVVVANVSFKFNVFDGIVKSKLLFDGTVTVGNVKFGLSVTGTFGSVGSGIFTAANGFNVSIVFLNN